MSTFGRYWADPIRLEEAVAHQTESTMFTACRYIPAAKNREYYTEYDELADVEVRFLAAMVMAVGFDEGLVAPYPVSDSFALEYDGPLHDPDFLHAAEKALRTEIAGMRRLATSPPILAIDGPPFEYHHRPLNPALLAEIFLAVSTDDDLMMRGLHALLKSRMVAMHAEFAEEANYALYIALDALFSLVRRQLMKAGNPNPSSYDAQSFVHRLCNEDQSGMRFFEEFYDDRIMTMHPDNRYGIFRHAPISHCDFHSLFGMVREVYREFALFSKIAPGCESAWD
ncbi:hypothetical protein M527_14535 [Sphingobium indicum IP26]|uniref:Uncharacterized protein n=2 Tax=Sphingomonadaceae TaxID=41297 RepID=A0A8E0WUJ8_9SPHN|nr:hypothetical protein M527_14535 [Sphingobium indicum IP26]EQB06466.1 hypothetical protein L286_06515 [Sphingobium sp. HDIP04]KER37675.1 hypothetical protein AL00_03970 [Sphingobium indicum F2]